MCARTDTVFLHLSEVSKGTVSLTGFSFRKFSLDLVWVEMPPEAASGNSQPPPVAGLLLPLVAGGGGSGGGRGGGRGEP